MEKLCKGGKVLRGGNTLPGVETSGGGWKSLAGVEIGVEEENRGYGFFTVTP